MQHKQSRITKTGTLALTAGLLAMFGSMAPAQAAIKVACIGPQHVHSHQLNYPQEYPAMLQKLLGAAYQVENFGDCCATILQGYPRQKETHPYLEGGEKYPAVGGKNFNDSIKFMPDIVVIGPWGKHDTEIANMLYKGVLDRAKFEKDYEQLLRTYLDLPSKPRVIVMPVIPIPMGKPDGVATSVMQPAMLAVAAKMPVTMVDVYPAFLNKPELFKDATHITNTTGLQTITNMVGAAIMAGPSDAGSPPPADAASTPDTAGTGGSPAGTGGAAATGTGGSSAGSGGSSISTGGSSGSSSTGGSPTASGGSPGTGGSSAGTGGSTSSSGSSEPAPSSCSYGGGGTRGAGLPALLVLAAAALFLRRRR